jgi:hypothetical protein
LEGDLSSSPIKVPMTLDIRAGHIILQVKEVLPSGFLLLEGKE